MRIAVKLFAGARDLAATERAEVEIAKGATVRDLRTALNDAYPTLAPLLPHALFAIDAAYATDETEIPDHAEIACIPPVSGG